jgi:hypothetical protein
MVVDLAQKCINLMEACHHPSVLVTRGGRGPCLKQAS